MIYLKLDIKICETNIQIIYYNILIKVIFLEKKLRKKRFFMRFEAYKLYIEEKSP